MQKCVYYYPRQISCSCGKSIQLRTINPTYQILSNDMIINNFLESSTCNDCGTLITKDNINLNLLAYLEPKGSATVQFTSATYGNYTIYLFCPICGKDTGYYIQGQYQTSMNPFFRVDSFGGYNSHDLNNCQLTSNDTNHLIQDYTYFTSQLNKRNKLGLITIN